MRPPQSPDLACPKTSANHKNPQFLIRSFCRVAALLAWLKGRRALLQALQLDRQRGRERMAV
jgi:hypothetical protein